MGGGVVAPGGSSSGGRILLCVVFPVLSRSTPLDNDRTTPPDRDYYSNDT